MFNDRRLAREFLRRYFAGDGCFQRTGGVYSHVSAASASKAMMEAVDSLIRKDGVLPMRKFAAGKPRIDGEKLVSDTWHIFVSHRKSLDKMSDMLLMGHRLDAERLASAAVKEIDSPAYESRDGCAVVEVSDIDEVPNKHGHVVSIETENHLYITSGGMAVHNCFPKDAAAIIRAAEKRGFEPKLLKAVDARNDELRGEAGLDTDKDQLA